MCLNSGTQNCSDLKTFSDSRLNGGGRKNVRFQRKTNHISETLKDRARVTISRT